MSSYSRIVVGSDGSESARDAVAVAGALAARLSAPVTAVTAWKTSIEVLGARDERWAQRTSLGTDVDLHDKGVRDVKRVEVKGDPAESLIDIGAEGDASLIVVGAHGLDGSSGRFSGSTANNLAHHSLVDVLYVRRRVSDIKTVALATDGSETSLTAVRRGHELAAALGAEVTLITVAESVDAGEAILGEVEQKLGSADGAVERRVLTGSAASSLIDGTNDYDLLVIGNRGMSGFARVLGSTANKVTHDSATNLLLVNTTRS